MTETIQITTTTDVVLHHALELAGPARDGEDQWERQARGLDELGYTIVGRTEDDARRAAAAQTPGLRAELDATRRVAEQRVADLQAEFQKCDGVRDRQLSRARGAIAAVKRLCDDRYTLEPKGRRSVDVDEVLAALSGSADDTREAGHG